MTFSDIFKDKNGKISGTSVSKICIVFGVLIVWLIASLFSHPIVLATIPEEVVWLVCGALGVGVANKGIDCIKKNPE